jgi:serine/threonine protein kinase
MFICPDCGAAFAAPARCPADGHEALPRGDDDLLGEMVGPYRIARLLGAGGMGRVYKAVHPSIGSRVAVKVLARECAERRDLVDRFFAEARTVNLIRHESIVNVLDLSAFPDGRPCIVMEHLDGAPLADLIGRRGPLPLGSVARLVGEVLDALAAAHAKGIVHRDLKPDNVFVSPQGRAKVLDFGIAKLQPELTGTPGPTRTGAVLGTPHYMAPEQALGRPVDARADVYAVGVMLFEAVTGQRPFTGDSLYELLHNQVSLPPPPPRQLRPELPLAYEGVILAALVKDPAARLPSALAFADALAAAAAELPPSAWLPLGGSARQPAARAQLATAPTFPTPPAPGTGPGFASTELPPPLGLAGSSAPAGRRRAGAWAMASVSAAVAVASVAVLLARGGADAPPASTATPSGSPSGSPSDTSSDTPSAPRPGGTVIAETDPLPATPPGDDQPLQPDDATASRHATLAPSPGRNPPLPAPEAPTTPAPKPRPPKPAPGDLSDKPDKARADDTPDAPAPAPAAPAKPAFGQIANVPGSFTPKNFQPTRFDPSAFFPEALRRARARYPDAAIAHIYLEAVYPDGHIDFTLTKSMRAQWMFYSRANGKPADAPAGLEYRGACVFVVSIDPFAGAMTQIPDTILCHQYERTSGTPRCSLAQVWKRAIALGAPDGNAVAEISYAVFDPGGPTWMFEVGSFSKSIRDDCR